MKAKFIVVLCFLAFFILIYYTAAHSEELQWTSKEECMNNFNVVRLLKDRMNLNNKAWVEYNNLFANYFTCRSIVSGDIGECDNLINPEPRKRCQEENERFGFWIRLAKKKDTSLNDCNQLPSGESREKCKNFIGALGEQKASACQGDKNCIAVANLDDSLTEDPIAKEKIILRKALRGSDVSQCQKIKNLRGVDIRSTCKAVLTGNMKACQECSGFDKIRSDYCDWLDRKLKMAK